MTLKNESIQLILAFASALLLTAIFSAYYEFRLINTIIVTHVILGVVAFLVGAITFLSEKGGRVHRVSGRVFYISMTISVLLTLVVSVAPYHVSPSLFQIGILSLYLLIGGRRSLSFRMPSHTFLYDKLLAITVVVVSLVVMLYSVVSVGEFYPLRTVFGIIGITFGSIDLWLFQSEKSTKKKWLALHLSKMVGGYTAAVTAFFVAQKFLGGYYDWFVPTVFGLGYVFYWLVKIKAIKLISNRSPNKTQTSS